MALRKMIMIAITTTIIVGSLLTLTTIGALGAPKGTGRVSAINVGAYLDSDCTIKCTAIDWGNMKSGSTTTKTIYIKNSGGTNTTLSISTSSWNPKWAKSSLTLSWNLNNYRLSAGQAVPATFTLAAALNTGSLTNFTFTITITGT